MRIQIQVFTPLGIFLLKDITIMNNNHEVCISNYITDCKEQIVGDMTRSIQLLKTSDAVDNFNF